MTTNNEADLILRDKLALDRTRMANQRTFLAFVRTGMYFIVTALAVFHLEEKTRFGFFEWSLFGMGGLAILGGVLSYFLTRKKVRYAITSDPQVPGETNGSVSASLRRVEVDQLIS